MASTIAVATTMLVVVCATGSALTRAARGLTRTDQGFNIRVSPLHLRYGVTELRGRPARRGGEEFTQTKNQIAAGNELKRSLSEVITLLQRVYHERS